MGIGSTVKIVDNDRAYTRIPAIRVDDFRKGLIGLISDLYPKFYEDLSEVPAGKTIFISGPYTIVAPTEKFPREPKVVQMCVKGISDSRLFHLATIEAVL